MNSTTLNLRHLEVELDALLAQFLIQPRADTIDFTEYKRRFVNRMVGAVLQAIGDVHLLTHPAIEPAHLLSRGRPARHSNAEVIQAALAIEAQGKRVTGSKIRKVLGGGRVERLSAIWAEFAACRDGQQTQAETSSSTHNSEFQNPECHDFMGSPDIGAPEVAPRKNTKPNNVLAAIPEDPLIAAVPI